MQHNEKAEKLRGDGLVLTLVIVTGILGGVNVNFLRVELHQTRPFAGNLLESLWLTNIGHCNEG
jgi:hypothetical protein